LSFNEGTIMESRVHREVYARFGEGIEQTCYGNIARWLFPTPPIISYIRTRRHGTFEREVNANECPLF
jgi:hypothetical protein